MAKKLCNNIAFSRYENMIFIGSNWKKPELETFTEMVEIVAIDVKNVKTKVFIEKKTRVCRRYIDALCFDSDIQEIQILRVQTKLI